MRLVQLLMVLVAFFNLCSSGDDNGNQLCNVPRNCVLWLNTTRAVGSYIIEKTKFLLQYPRVSVVFPEPLRISAHFQLPRQVSS